MRGELQHLHNKGYISFEATIGKMGSRNNFHGFPEEILLLLDVTIQPAGYVIGHVWIGKTKSTELLFDVAKTTTNKTMVSFLGKILENRRYSQYDGLKLVGETIDYKIGYITNVEFLNKKSVI